MAALPHTPVKSGRELELLIEKLNADYDLELPNPTIYSPTVRRKNEKSLRWRSYLGIKRLYFNRTVNVHDLLSNFDEWVYSRRGVPNVHGSARSSSLRPRDQLVDDDGGGGGGRDWVSQDERDERRGYLMKLIDDEIYLLNNGPYSPVTKETKGRDIGVGGEHGGGGLSMPLKRRLLSEDEDEEDEFHTAPNSPEKSPGRRQALGTNKQLAGVDPINAGPALLAKMPKLEERERGKEPSKFLRRLTGADNFPRYDAVSASRDQANVSFSTSISSHLFDSHGSHAGTSFGSNATEVIEPTTVDSDSVYDGYSVVGHFLSQERMATATFDTSEVATEEDISERAQYSIEGEIIGELLQNGPFSLQESFPDTIPLRYRYELERIGRFWGVPFDRMLVGNSINLNYDDFWKWIGGHNQREDRPLPEKPTRRAFDAAVGDFRTDKHSEVTVLTGDLAWCDEHEPGILKLKLHPLKTEKACRFHRRFGADRFLSLTVPAPTRPPRHLRFTSHPTLLRESLALWLTQNVHRCLGRTWKPFYVEEVKSKRKTKAMEPKFRVEFFAIDGVDFDHGYGAPLVAASRQPCDRHTPMSLESLLEWHMPPGANVDQSNCKLFQRISLGLSKTFATVSLKPSQILPLPDEPGRPVMNDGCALMSRSLANKICDSLSISGNTPSCFQGRIAGAKGLWMADRHQSHVSGDDDDLWIQISDSQLKIHPHPHFWQEPADEEQLTFEVVKWSKPLHPVDLNIQLLGILEHGGRMRDYIADLTRAGIQAFYQDFADVLQANSAVLCRSLIQKIRPPADDGGSSMPHKSRRLEQWMANEAECIIRLCEAGFSPQTFYHLRRKLGSCLRGLLDRAVEEFHVEVPLSTYAFCIADPYGVLDEDEVHFGFSNNWRDPHGQFEDNLLDGVDVLVGRLPAHVPSDIQRRRAVWKPELRHFKDVIVFPTRGAIPLAHMLSGGDYDGDTPWICWDQNIVQQFRNTDLPTDEFPPDHFGLTKHSVPMRDIQCMDEFLQSAFTFNLTLSNLGRCTVEHEKLAYDESIDSRKATELACLLSHLVDGRKGGVHLSEPAWKAYRQRISPRVRDLPAYRNPDRRPKPANIIDYLKFEVAVHERHSVLVQLEQAFPERSGIKDLDADLVRPWDDVHRQANWEKKHADKRLYAVLKTLSRDIDRVYTRWTESLSRENEYSAVTRDAAERVQRIPPPSPSGGDQDPDQDHDHDHDHPMIHTWQHSRDEWLRLLASYTYKRYSHSSFAMHAFGETLCRIKTEGVPSRTITNEMLGCYRVNQKIVSQLTAQEVSTVTGAPEGENDEDDEEDGFEGQDAMEAMVPAGTMHVPGGYYDFDDGMSIE